MMIGIELVRDRQTKEPFAPYNGSSPEMAAFRKYMLDHGVYIYTHWHTVLVIPPLIISEEQLAEGFAVLDRALRNLDSAESSFPNLDLEQLRRSVAEWRRYLADGQQRPAPLRITWRNPTP